MLREYEFTLVARAGSETETAKTIEKYEGILTANGGDILKKDSWGTKRLAYPINDNFKGHYVFYNIATQPANIAEAERLMRIDDEVLRYMPLKVADRVDVAARKVELAKVVVPKEVN
jgi:small subunit ribosomal protein S6